MSAILNAQNLCKAFRRRKVVKEVSFSVDRGEIVGLLGPNGAGKSTSFNMVAGLVAPDSGAVTLDGHDLAQLPLYRRAQLGLGYLPQDSTVFRGLSVSDNLVVAYEAQGVTGKAARAEAYNRLAEYDLLHVRDNLGSQLSGGERRRVEMARTLIPKPKVVLLDEPFAGVDPIAVGEIKKFIRTMREEGIGVLVTDHNVRETLGICDRAYLINEGKIFLTGRPEEIVANDEARATYLGEDFTL